MNGPSIFIVHEECHGAVSWWLSEEKAKQEVVDILLTDFDKRRLPRWWAAGTTERKYRFFEERGGTCTVYYEERTLERSWA